MIALTFDVDWAPDFVIENIAARLSDRGVKATWFLTHESKAGHRLRDHPNLFELGIHPNLLPGSSHGSTPSEVLDTCMSLVPEATSMRTHSLVQSTRFFAQVVEETPIRADVSLFLPGHGGLRPVVQWMNGAPLVRVPYMWEDDFEMGAPEPVWDLGPFLDPLPGIKVVDFHPVHVYLNSASLIPYSTCKLRVGDLTKATEADLRPYINDGVGAGTAFDSLVSHLAANDGGSLIRDVAAFDGNMEPSRPQMEKRV